MRPLQISLAVLCGLVWAAAYPLFTARYSMTTILPGLLMGAVIAGKLIAWPRTISVKATIWLSPFVVGIVAFALYDGSPHDQLVLVVWGLCFIASLVGVAIASEALSKVERHQEPESHPKDQSKKAGH